MRTDSPMAGTGDAKKKVRLAVWGVSLDWRSFIPSFLPLQTLNIITPVTILQLSTATATPDDTSMLDGYELGHVKVVGQIISLSEASGNAVTLTIDDSTAVIDCRVWLEREVTEGQTGGSAGAAVNTATKAEWAREHQYVAVIGYLKTFSGRKTIVANRIRTVRDSNEITYHSLEATYVSLLKAKGQYNAGVSLPSGPAMAVDPSTFYPQHTDPMVVEGAASHFGGAPDMLYASKPSPINKSPNTNTHQLTKPGFSFDSYSLQCSVLCSLLMVVLFFFLKQWQWDTETHLFSMQELGPKWFVARTNSSQVTKYARSRFERTGGGHQLFNRRRSSLHHHRRLSL